MRMRSFFLAAAVAFTPAASAAAMSQLAHSGYWETDVGVSDANEPMCVMSTFGDQNMYVGVKYFAGANGLTIHVSRPGWNITPGERFDVGFEFDRKGGWAGTATAITSDSLTLPVFNSEDGAVATFLEEFASSREWVIDFPGSERNWILNMEGSRTNANAFASCISAVVAGSNRTSL